MRCALRIVAVTTVAMSPTVHAEALPPGSIGALMSALSGAGADAKTLGAGYAWGAQAAWQPASTERRLGWSIKWSVSFATMWLSDASRIEDELQTLQMDLMVGLRVRPSDNPRRYLALRAGGAMFRANQVIPPSAARAFIGPIASVGLDQYFSGWMLNVDVRYGLIGDGPTELGLVIGISKTGP